MENKDLLKMLDAKNLERAENIYLWGGHVLGKFDSWHKPSAGKAGIKWERELPDLLMPGSTAYGTDLNGKKIALDGQSPGGFAVFDYRSFKGAIDDQWFEKNKTASSNGGKSKTIMVREALNHAKAERDKDLRKVMEQSSGPDRERLEKLQKVETCIFNEVYSQNMLVTVSEKMKNEKREAMADLLAHDTRAGHEHPFGKLFLEGQSAFSSREEMERSFDDCRAGWSMRKDSHGVGRDYKGEAHVLGNNAETARYMVESSPETRVESQTRDVKWGMGGISLSDGSAVPVKRELDQRKVFQSRAQVSAAVEGRLSKPKATSGAERDFLARMEQTSKEAEKVMAGHTKASERAAAKGHLETLKMMEADVKQGKPVNIKDVMNLRAAAGLDPNQKMVLPKLNQAQRSGAAAQSVKERGMDTRGSSVKIKKTERTQPQKTWSLSGVVDSVKTKAQSMSTATRGAWDSIVSKGKDFVSKTRGSEKAPERMLTIKDKALTLQKEEEKLWVAEKNSSNSIESRGASNPDQGKKESLSFQSNEVQKPVEAKATEQKPQQPPRAQEAKPAETPKPVEAKATEQKPQQPPRAQEAKPMETPKPVEAKATEQKPQQPPRAQEARPAEPPRKVDAVAVNRIQESPGRKNLFEVASLNPRAQDAQAKLQAQPEARSAKTDPAQAIPPRKADAIARAQTQGQGTPSQGRSEPARAQSQAQAIPPRKADALAQTRAEGSSVSVKRTPPPASLIPPRKADALAQARGEGKTQQPQQQPSQIRPPRAHAQLSAMKLKESKGGNVVQQAPTQAQAKPPVPPRAQPQPATVAPSKPRVPGIER